MFKTFSDHTIRFMRWVFWAINVVCWVWVAIAAFGHPQLHYRHLASISGLVSIIVSMFLFHEEQTRKKRQATELQQESHVR